MIWWILGIAISVVFVIFAMLLVRGADSRKTYSWMRQLEDEQQEKAIREMKNNRGIKTSMQD